MHPELSAFSCQCAGHGAEPGHDRPNMEVKTEMS
jgi:hypothetical protein